MILIQVIQFKKKLIQSNFLFCLVKYGQLNSNKLSNKFVVIIIILLIFGAITITLLAFFLLKRKVILIFLYFYM